MKNIFLLLVFFFSLSYGQVKMKGKILDSLNSPLESASIVAINKLTNGLENYALSDKEGKYELSLKENNGYKIQVSSIGLITINDTIKTKEQIFLKIIF